MTEKYIILPPIHLGTGQLGQDRKKALEQLAAEADCFYNDKPSVGRWLVKLADEELNVKEQVNELL